MKQFLTLVALLAILACSVASAILATAAETAVNRAADYAEAPPSAVDTVMRSRETAPAEPANRSWGVIGLLAVAGGIAAAIILGLRNGGEFLRQGRLTVRAWQRPATGGAAGQLAQMDQMYQARYEEAQQAPIARRPPALPYHDVDYSD